MACIPDLITSRVDPDRSYTTHDLASLLGCSVSSVYAAMTAGLLPAQAVPGTGKGRGKPRTWTGAALLDAARRSTEDLPDLDHAARAASTLWRLGCGCDDCLHAHNAETREHRHRHGDRVFPEAARRQLLRMVSAGTPLDQAAAAAGVTRSQVYGRACWDSEFGGALDEAAQALCADPGRSACGTARAYRFLRCRGTACRTAHASAG
jgi:hypothetical protein